MRFDKFLGLALGATGGGVDSLLSNQSDRLDFVEKSFNSCDCISLAVETVSWPSLGGRGDSFVPANLALPSPFSNDGLSPNARAPHHIKSCLIRLGSVIPSLSICLKNSALSTSSCGKATWYQHSQITPEIRFLPFDFPESIRELALRPLLPRLLLLDPLDAPFRISLFRRMIGVSANGRAILVASKEI